MSIDKGELKLVENSKRKVGANANYYFTVLEDNNEDERFMFTETELERAKYRASRNPEDWMPRRSFFSRVFRAMKKAK